MAQDQVAAQLLRSSCSSLDNSLKLSFKTIGEEQYSTDLLSVDVNGQLSLREYHEVGLKTSISCPFFLVILTPIRRDVFDTLLSRFPKEQENRMTEEWDKN
ncbi:hypothetical protein CEXT_269831 [Caerostris extrusa]|uniref:Uncharacterized protein n=1 Tax=Caerostris extrusa TaxID=172846 RepID=A0AAV4NMH5_CAEEX|nr:hypothetical protein CEXT_269831 [Caerostris extrusa]